VIATPETDENGSDLPTSMQVAGRDATALNAIMRQDRGKNHDSGSTDFLFRD
jgi:hypothetical protein